MGFHNIDLADDLERLQKRALRIIYSSLTYSEALAASNLPTQYNRRDTLTKQLFNDISSNVRDRSFIRGGGWASGFSFSST
jgi:hypothetical protein